MLMETTFYQQLIAQAPFGYAHHKALLDENGEVLNYVFIEVNQAFEELTGLKTNEVVGRKITDILHQATDSALDWLSCYWEVAHARVSQSFEQYSRPLDKWYNVQVTLSGHDHFTTIFTDITKSKKTELLIQAANTRIQQQRSAVVQLLLNEAIALGDLDLAAPFITKLLAQTIHVARASVWLLSDDGEELRCISLYESQLKRYSSGTVLYSKDYPHYFKTLKTETRIYADNAQIDPRTSEFNVFYHLPLGITALLDAGVVVNGKVLGVVCLEHIGTSRKWQPDEESFSSTAASVVSQIIVNMERNKAEAELRQSEQRFRDVVDAMGEAVYEFDTDFNGIYLSDEIKNITGLTPEEQLKYNAIDLIHPDDVVYVHEVIADCFATKKAFRGVEYRGTHKEGHYVWVSASGSPILDEKGNITGLRGTLKDITMRRQAEAETLRREAAEAANKAKSEFLANMSHEIRTPLNAVIGFTDLLQNTPLNNVQQQYVENANTAAHSLLGIINDILDFSKIEAGKLELDINKTDIIELLEHTADIVKYSSAQKNLELLLNIPPNLPRYANVDAVRLKQILMNLLSNAVKFTEAGEVELSLTLQILSPTQAQYNFAVRDTGIGIDKQEQDKLFQAFSQADTSTTRRFGGTGLGLTISNMLAQKMGSPIAIDSQPKAGSTFSFSLVAEYETGEKINNDNIQHVQRVLVIDDNDNNRLILQHIFEYWHIQFTGINNGFAALKLLETQHFDVIIVDYNMPQLDGIATIRLIRQQKTENAQKQPVILLHSSSDDERIYDACRQLDVHCKLVKPVKVEELYQCLNTINKPSPLHKTNNIQQREAHIIPELHALSPVILVAEDVAINRLLVKKVIQQIMPQAKIIEAQDGFDAFHEATRQDIDLILMDVQMPKKDGYTCTKELRQHEKNSSHSPVPIIALTAGAVQEDKNKCLAVGMNDFLTKPIDKAALINIFKTYLCR
jgi:PAS domain S-box-containing protein